MYVESNGHLTMQANTETSDDTFYFLFINYLGSSIFYIHCTLVTLIHLA